MIKPQDITVSDFKAYFFRDFEYAQPLGAEYPIPGCPKDYITDFDIQKAFKEAIVNFNPGLFSTDDQLEVCYLYLTAHYLVNDIQTAQQGVNSAGYAPVNSRSVGSVSESYTLPDWMAQDPYLSNFTTTRYGQKYLSMIKPLLIGNVQVYQGWTTFQ
jgi:hypothetical protein